MSLRGCAVLIALWIPACGGCDGEGPGGPEGTIDVIDPGTGDPNAEPLLLLRPGLRVAEPGQAGNFTVDGPLEISGRELLRFDRGDANVYFDSKIVTRRQIDWLREEDAGVVVHGTEWEGFYEEPTVIVPTTVRNGMVWKSGGTTYRATRAMAETNFGFLPTWEIKAIESERTMAGLEGPFHGWLLVTYIEGRGIATTSASFTPLDDVSGTTPPTQSKQSLSSIPFASEGYVTNAWAMSGPGGETYVGVIELVPNPADPTNQTIHHTCYRFAGTSLSDVGYRASDGAHQQFTVGPAGCYEGDGQRFANHPERAWLAADGTGYHIPTDAYGVLPDLGHLNVAGAAAIGMFGVRKTDGGVVPRMVWDTGMDWVSSDWYQPTMVSGTLDLVPLARHGNPLVKRHTLGLQFTQYTITPELLVAPAIVDEGATVPLGFILPGGTLARTEVPLAGGNATSPRLDRYVPPFRSVHLTTSEREVLIPQPDGGVDRLVVEVGGTRLERIAQVEIPAHHSLRHVFRVGQQLLVFTLDQSGTTPKTKAWTVTVPSGAPRAVPATPGLAVSAQMQGADALVCGPGDATEAGAWTLGGAAPAKVVPVLPGCVLLVRDHAASVSLDDPASKVIEGPVPGAGRMRIYPVGDSGHPANLMNNADTTRMFELADGTLYGGRYLYARGGIVTNPSGFSDPQTPNDQDLAGLGAWQFVFPNIQLVAGDVKKTSMTFNTAGLVGRVQTGGALFGENGAVYRIGTDLSVTQDLYAAGLAYPTVMANGSLCGVHPTVPSIECKRSGGTIETATIAEFPTNELIASGLPLGDSIYFSDFIAGTYRFDTVGMTFTKIDDDTFHTHVYARDGRLYGVRGKGTGAPVVEVTPTGLVDVAIPPRYASPSTPNPVRRVVPDGDLLLIGMNDGQTFRIPRP